MKIIIEEKYYHSVSFGYNYKITLFLYLSLYIYNLVISFTFELLTLRKA